jgi:hypothetical protein
VSKDWTAVIERAQHKCELEALEMRCPCHQRNARIMVDGENLNDISIEVFACCDPFRKRVHDAMMDQLSRAAGSF